MYLSNSEVIVLNFEFETLEDANNEIANILSNVKYQNKTINYNLSYSKQGVYNSNLNETQEYELVSLNVNIE